jgi:hypothetical protein
MYFYIYDLLKDLINSSESIALNGKVTSEQWIGKGVEGSGRDIIRQLPGRT